VARKRTIKDAEQLGLEATVKIRRKPPSLRPSSAVSGMDHCRRHSQPRHDFLLRRNVAEILASANFPQLVMSIDEHSNMRNSRLRLLRNEQRKQKKHDPAQGNGWTVLFVG